MINLKTFFRPNPHLLSVSKAEKDVLECFLDNKAEFEQWLPFQQNQRVRFQFYYPTAVDFYFDNFKLFTAYFKKGTGEAPVLTELKMSEANYSTIRTASWQPFEEVMVKFLHSLEEKNKLVLNRKNKSLHEYAMLCNDSPTEKERPGQTSMKPVNV